MQEWQCRQKWQCRIAGSLGGGFAGTPNEVWGTVDYTDLDAPAVFFGLYGMRDLQDYFAHRGPKSILWAGSDIRNLANGYFLDREGDWRLDIEGELNIGNSFCENILQAIVLESLGIKADIVPSFLGDVEKFPVQTVDVADQPRYYTSVSGDDWELYGIDELVDWAVRYPEVDFHLYGNEKEPPLPAFDNLIVHGRVSQNQMDAEIKRMTGAIRLTRFDGFSEILAKSILWGQQPISPYIYYPHVGRDIGDNTVYNRDYYLKNLNAYPFNANYNRFED